MKRKLPKWSGVAALVLLAGALGVLAWQGSRHLTAVSGNTPARLAAVSETVTDTGTLPAEESQPCPQTAAVTRQTETSVTSDSSPQTAVTFPLELNAAGAAELEQLPGIGAVLAQRIVAYRDQIGGFSNREQLLEVEGIGEATLYEIYDLLYLENETFPEPEPEPEPAGAPAPAAAPQPAETAPPATEPPAAAAPAVTFPLDLNQATAAELEQIPGMQPELAEKIVAFRQQIQAFSSVYELLYVDGMTEAYFVQLRDYVQITEELAQ